MDYPIIDMKKTGKRIKELCISRGITPKVIQNYMQFSNTQSIYNWFCGKTMPSLDNFYALSRMLQVPMDEILVPLNQDGGKQESTLIKLKKIA